MEDKTPNETSNQNTFPFVAMLSQRNFCRELADMYTVEMHSDATTPTHSNGSKISDFNYHLILASFEARKTFWGEQGGGCEYMRESVKGLMPL